MKNKAAPEPDENEVVDLFRVDVNIGIQYFSPAELIDDVGKHALHLLLSQTGLPPQGSTIELYAHVIPPEPKVLDAAGGFADKAGSHPGKGIKGLC